MRVRPLEPQVEIYKIVISFKVKSMCLSNKINLKLEIN